MTKYSTDSSDADSSTSKRIGFELEPWILSALSDVVKKNETQSSVEVAAQLFEFSLITSILWQEEHARSEKFLDRVSGKTPSVPGEYAGRDDFVCPDCKMDNKFLFRELQSEDSSGPEFLCLSCLHCDTERAYTKLKRAREIQAMDRYRLTHDASEIQSKYEGKFRTPMRFRCTNCQTSDLIVPDPEDTDVTSLICPRCSAEGEILPQMVNGLVVKGFEKYDPNERTHTQKEPLGRGESTGEFDDIAESYEDGYEP